MKRMRTLFIIGIMGSITLLCTGCVGRNFTLGEELDQEKIARSYLESYFQDRGMKAKVKELDIVGSHFERPQDGYDLTDYCDGYFEQDGVRHEFYVNTRTGQVYTDERNQEVQNILADYYLEKLGLSPIAFTVDPKTLYGLYVPETEGSTYIKTLYWAIPVDEDLDLREYVLSTLKSGDAFYETKIYEVGEPLLENTIDPGKLDFGADSAVTITECDEAVTELFLEDSFPDPIEFTLHQRGVVQFIANMTDASSGQEADTSTAEEIDEPAVEEFMNDSMPSEGMEDGDQRHGLEMMYMHFTSADHLGPVGVLYCDDYEGKHFDTPEEAVQFVQHGSIWTVTGGEGTAPICYLYVNDLSQVDGGDIAATHSSTYAKEMYDENYWRKTADGRYLLCEDFFYTLDVKPEYRPREVRKGSIFVFGDEVKKIPKENWRKKGQN